MNTAQTPEIFKELLRSLKTAKQVQYTIELAPDEKCRSLAINKWAALAMAELASESDSRYGIRR